MGQSLAIPRVIPNDWKRLDLIVNKIKMRLGSSGTPTFARVFTARGTAALPAYTFTDDPDTGMYLSAGALGEISFSHSGTRVFSIMSTDVNVIGVPLRLWDGAAATPSLTFYLDPNTGLYRVGNDQLGVTTGGVLRATFADAGLTLTGYIDQADIADPGAPAASKSRLFSNSGHTISLAPDDVWHDLSMGGLGTSSCVHDAITVTDADGLNITWSAGTIFDANIAGGDQMVTIAAQPANQACTASSINYLFFDRSGGVLVLNTTGPDYSDGDFSVAHIYTTHDDIFEIIYRPVDYKVTHNIKWALRSAFPSIVVSGLVVSAHAGAPAFDVDQSAGSFVYGGFTLIDAGALSASNIIRWYHNAANEWETDVNAQIDAANWDDDDDGITVKGTTAGKYYRSVFVTCGDCVHWIYPQVEYANLNAALVGVDPTLPSALEKLPKTNALIMKHGDGAFPIAGSDQWIDVRPILTGAAATGLVSDHSNLASLTFASAGHTGFQAQSDALDTIVALGAIADNEFIVGTGAGTYAHESGATVRTSLGLTIGTNVQAFSEALKDLDEAGTVTGDSYFLVGTAAGVLNWETTTTVRTSMGLGTGDSPQFTGIELGHADDTTITRVGAGVIAVEGVNVMMAGDAPAAHSIASHNDTTGTGAELNTLTGGGDVGALHTHAAAYQPLDAVLTDLAALTAVADNEFIVGTGAGTYGHENAATAATSMGLGVGDSPTFSNLSVTNTFSIVDLLVTGDSQLGDTVNLDTIGINMAPDADVLIKGTFSSTGSGGTFCYNHETFAHTEDDSTAATYVRGTDSTMQVNDDISANGILAATGHRQFVETNLTTITGVGTPTAYLYGYHAVVDWAAAALSGATYAACVVGFKADVTGNLGTTGNTIKRGADIAVSESAVTNYGGKFTATGATYNYGLYGYTTGAHTTNWGLYGYAAGATTNWGLYVAAGDAYFAGDISIVNNGTIGQAAGPLLAFDDTNNYLEITGCKVGIGTTTPSHGIVLQGADTTYAMMRTINTGASATNGGAGLGFYASDGAALLSGHRLGFFIFGGSYDGSGTLASGGAVTFYADENWGAGSTGARIQFETVVNGSAGRTERMRIDNSGGVFMYNLKAGADQAGAGAAADELYHDTDDNTIKIGV